MLFKQNSQLGLLRYKRWDVSPPLLRTTQTHLGVKKGREANSIKTTSNKIALLRANLSPRIVPRIGDFAAFTCIKLIPVEVYPVVTTFLYRIASRMAQINFYESPCNYFLLQKIANATKKRLVRTKL